MIVLNKKGKIILTLITSLFIENILINLKLENTTIVLVTILISLIIFTLLENIKIKKIPAPHKRNF